MTTRESLDIGFVGTLPPVPTGAAIMCAQLLNGLANRGHTVRVVAPITAETQDTGDAFARAYPHISVERFLVPYYATYSESEEYLRLEGEGIREGLTALLRERRPDIILIGRELYALFVPDLARLHSVPTLMIVHGGQTSAIINQTYLQAPADLFLTQCRKVDLIVTVASHWAESVRTLGLDRVVSIPNPVDLRRFSPRPKGAALLRALDIGEDDTIVLHASNLRPLKRTMDIVSSAQVALAQNPRLRYVIVGDGVTRAATEEACDRLKIASNFRFVGWVAHERMPGYINLADIVVMPSERETQALIYLEAQACARVMLASDIAAAREVIVDGETGLLFQMGDVNELAAKTLLAAGDSELRADIGQRARERALAHDLNTVAAEYEASLQETVRLHRGRCPATGCRL